MGMDGGWHQAGLEGRGAGWSTLVTAHRQNAAQSQARKREKTRRYGGRQMGGENKVQGRDTNARKLKQVWMHG